MFHEHRGEVVAAYEVAGELLHLSEEHGDAAAQVAGHRMVGSALFGLGRLVESREHFEAGLALCEPVPDQASALLYAIDSRVMCLSWLSHVLVILGYPDKAAARNREVSASICERTHPNTAAVALTYGSMFHQMIRNRQNAEEQAEAVIALASEQGFPLYLAAGTVVRGWALAGIEQTEDGIADIRRGLVDCGAGAENWLPYFLGLLAEALGRTGQPATGLNFVVDAVDRTGRSQARWIEAELHRLRGELLLALPEPDQAVAEACFGQALTVAREQSARMWELRSATGLARLLADQGNRQKAHDLLTPVYEWFTEGFDTLDLTEAKALLEALA